MSHRSKGPNKTRLVEARPRQRLQSQATPGLFLLYFIITRTHGHLLRHTFLEGNVIFYFSAMGTAQHVL